MKKRNERTSKKIASMASTILDDTAFIVADLQEAKLSISAAIMLLEKAYKVAGSALTMAPDKK